MACRSAICFLLRVYLDHKEIYTFIQGALFGFKVFRTDRSPMSWPCKAPSRDNVDGGLAQSETGSAVDPTASIGLKPEIPDCRLVHVSSWVVVAVVELVIVLVVVVLMVAAAVCTATVELV